MSAVAILSAFDSRYGSVVHYIVAPICDGITVAVCGKQIRNAVPGESVRGATLCPECYARAQCHIVARLFGKIPDTDTGVELDALWRAARRLRHPDRDVIALLFNTDGWQSVSRSAVAKELHITVERVRFSEARALVRLRGLRATYVLPQ